MNCGRFQYDKKFKKSILELLTEYNLERKEINYALSEGVIGIDKATSSSSQLNPTRTIGKYNILLRGTLY